MFEPWLDRWKLEPDGEAILTRSSRLLPVRHRGRPAMLKIACAIEERRGAALMRWWDGDGAMPVLAHEGDALLLERAPGTRSLATMARHGRDDEASRILCAVAARLHAPRPKPLPELVPLERWFAALWPGAERYGGVIAEAARVARELLAEPQEPMPLHGDLHHDNVLDDGRHGWRAIDPKGLLGERGFDFANIFRNPDLDLATRPGRLDQPRPQDRRLRRHVTSASRSLARRGRQWTRPKSPKVVRSILVIASASWPRNTGTAESLLCARASERSGMLWLFACSSNKTTFISSTRCSSCIFIWSITASSTREPDVPRYIAANGRPSCRRTASAS